MKLDDLCNLIENSTADEWSQLQRPQHPIFHPVNSSSGVELDVDHHGAVLTYRDDIDIQVAYGADPDFSGTGKTNHHPRKYDWAEDFFHPEGAPAYVHYLYCGNIVNEVWVISFDGAWLPSPTGYKSDGGDYELRFTGPSLRIARLLHSIDYAVDADEAERLMKQSGLPIEP